MTGKQPDPEEEEAPYLEFGRRLYALRNTKGQTQEELARDLDINVGAVSAYENGKRMPHPTTIVDFAKHFGVSTDHLLLGDPLAEHHELEVFHRFMATDLGRIALKRGWVDMLRGLRLPQEPTIQLYQGIVTALISSANDSESK